ncbi:MAG: pyruvate dehydrogenase (acetyl-transferring) E1 component subunit alpha [Sulfuricurvum sp.]|nr:pyruvate dehydrogenase (acetyl-transferring) E1 component subunit alpha [Sulfuricurvum sp.]
MDLDLANKLYHKMLLIRRFEEKCVEMYSKEKIRGFLHLYIGEEAVAVGVMHALSSEDAIFATYREHGHALARGIHPNRIMAELYGKQEGCSRGRGGSMHLFDAATRFYGGIAIVTGGLPMAIGMALSDKMMKRNKVTVCFFGEGAVAEGEFHESLNLAALWHLPILFVCENNLYAMGTALEFTQSETNISLKAASYRITSKQIDGMNVTEVAESSEEAIAQIRSGNGPVFLECLTYRFRAHSMYDAELYRQKSEVEEWKQKDPLIRLPQDWSDINIAQHEEEISHIIDEAVEFAENGTLESVDDLEKFIYSSEVAR